MAPARGGSRIQLRILVLFLCLGLVPLILGYYALIGGAEARLRGTVGLYFGHRCDQLQDEIADYIESLQAEVVNLAALPVVLEELKKVAPPDERTNFDRAVAELEARWPQLEPGRSQELDAILERPASVLMRSLNRVTAHFREILLADRYGRLVAATGKTSDYYQADEEWWRVTYLEGRGQSYLSDIQYDESMGIYSVDIAEPVRDPESGEVLGILKAVSDSHSLFRIVDNLRFGETSAAIILRRDGTLVTSPGSDERYPFVDQVNSSVDRGVRWLEVPEDDPKLFLGLPSARLAASVPQLDWVVVIEAERNEVFAPFRNLRSWYAYLAVFGLVLVVVLSLIFTWFLSKPIVEVDPHLDQIGS